MQVIPQFDGSICQIELGSVERETTQSLLMKLNIHRYWGIDNIQ